MVQVFGTCDVTSHDNILYFYIATFLNYYYYYCVIIDTNIRPFFVVIILLNLWCTPLLRLQVADYSTFSAMFDVPIIIVFCKVYCVLSSFIFSHVFSSLVTIPLVPVISGI